MHPGIFIFEVTSKGASWPIMLDAKDIVCSLILKMQALSNLNYLKVWQIDRDKFTAKLASNHDNDGSKQGIDLKIFDR